MAPPRGGGPRRSQVNEHLFTLGERGRKTGVMLRDTGVRDEHGMEPIDSIFSSPAKSRDGDATGSEEEEEEEEEEGDLGEDEDATDEDTGEADMDLTTGPGPATLLNGTARRFSRSPPSKALYGSPAVRPSNMAVRQNHMLKPPSSPGDTQLGMSPVKPDRPVSRKLDFGKPLSANGQRKPTLLPQSRKGPQQVHDLHHHHNNNRRPSEPLLDTDDSVQLFAEPIFDQVINDAEEEEEEEEQEEEEEEEPEEEQEEQEEAEEAEEEVAEPEEPEEEDEEPVRPVKKRRGRPSKGSVPAPAPAPTKGKRTRSTEKTQEVTEKRSKRQRVETIEEPDSGRDEADQPRSGLKKWRWRWRLRQRQRKKPEAEPEAEPEEPEPEPVLPKKRGRKRKSSGVGAATAAAAAVPRGPPLPKSRGLVIRRRQLADDEAAAGRQTRSGRTSIRPLAFWRNEHFEFDPEQVQSSNQERFLLPAVKEVYRVEEEQVLPLSTKGRGRGRPGRPGRKRVVYHDDNDNDIQEEAWERGVGTVTAPVVVWTPDMEVHPPGPETELELDEVEVALAGSKIQLDPVRDGGFQFAKTLTSDFFGTGIMEIPAGGEKRPKNARKMHLMFFVHKGQVTVNVNGTSFRISKGGVWNVPRGNTYSIANETDSPASIFFAQACERLVTVDSEGQVVDQ